MSLLSVTVKKAQFVGVQATQFNTYVTLKLQNVKTTTVTVKGPNPCWEQDFLFETNDVNTGLLIEVWSKGMLWDRALGYHWLPLPGVKYSNEEGSGQWLSLEAELVMRDGEVVGTKTPTGHSLLIDCRFELPFDADNAEGADLQRKLEYLNSLMDQEARAEQARRQLQYIGHSGYSEDSDYTSDVNYPVGQHANSSASQFRSAAHHISTPQRSLETSRENSCERDDAIGRPSPRYETEPEPLFYNSRPSNYKEYTRRRKRSWEASEPISDPWYTSSGYHNYSHSLDETGDGGYYQPTESTLKRSGRGGSHRRPSLERQNTLYDDQYYDSRDYASQPYSEYEEVGFENNTFQANQQYSTEYSQPQGYPEYYPADGNQEYNYQEERYGQEDEDRQWDSGGTAGDYPIDNSYDNGYDDQCYTTPPETTESVERFETDQYKNRLNSARNAKEPFDPPAKRMPVTRVPHSTSEYYDAQDEPARPTRPAGHQLPATPLAASTADPSTFYQHNYNEDYNYAYESIDNLTRKLEEEPVHAIEAPPPKRELPTLRPSLRQPGVVRQHTLPQQTKSPLQEQITPTIIPQIANSYETTAIHENSLIDYGNAEEYPYMGPGEPMHGTIELTAATVHHNGQAQVYYDYTSNLSPIGQCALPTAISPNLGTSTTGPSLSGPAPLSTATPAHAPVSGLVGSGSVRKNFLRSHETSGGSPSPLLQQQNTDSLESRDDELRDSFETAVSSVSSSLQPPRKGTRPGLYDYSTPLEGSVIGALATTASISVPTVSTVFSNTTVVLNTLTDGRTPLISEAIIKPKDEGSVPSRGYLMPQESLDSCAEEVIRVVSGINGHAEIEHENLTMDNLGRQSINSHRENSLIEPYQHKVPTPATSPSPPSMGVVRASMDRGQTISEDISPTGSRTVPLGDDSGAKSKSVSFEDAEPSEPEQPSSDEVIPADSLPTPITSEPPTQPERRKMTAKERWHYAFNKIVHQLNWETPQLVYPYDF